MSLMPGSPPVDLAFEVFVRSGGKEYRVGSVNFQKGVHASYLLKADRFPGDLTAPVEIILRSSEAVAKTTIDLRQIWKGEIILPAQVRGPSSLPAVITPGGDP